MARVASLPLPASLPSGGNDFLLPTVLFFAALAVCGGGWLVGLGELAPVSAGVLMLFATTFGADAVATAARRPDCSSVVATLESVRRVLARQANPTRVVR